MFRCIKASFLQLTLSLSLLATKASGQTQPFGNVFFGFDFILHPIAMKWLYGGAPDQDLHQINALIEAFPKDAEQAGVQSAIGAMLNRLERQASLSEILNAKISKQQEQILCTAALPLNIDWLTPEYLTNDDGSAYPPEQKVVREAFFKIVEKLQ